MNQEYLDTVVDIIAEDLRRGVDLIAAAFEEDQHPRDEKGQWASTGKQTDSAAFKAWFGESKVVDTDGKPLHVYHGTKNDFDQFGKAGELKDWDTGYSGRGFYFADHSIASIYAGDEKGSKVLPVYLRLTNPLEIQEVKGGDDQIIQVAKQLKIALPEGIHGINAKRIMPSLSDDISKALHKAGHDGVIYTWRGGQKEYMVLKPTQIKSAIGNKGTYDPNNPVITLGERVNFAISMVGKSYAEVEAALRVAGFDPAQARDENGKWSTEVDHKIDKGQLELEHHQSGSKLERLSVFDAETGEKLHDMVGEPDRVDSYYLPPETVATIDMHTHPDKTSFSDGDWKRFAWSHVQEMRVIGSENVFTLTKEKRWNEKDWKERTPKIIEKRWNTIFDEKTSGTDWNEHTVLDDVNKQMAKEFGVKFSSYPRDLTRITKPRTLDEYTYQSTQINIPEPLRSKILTFDIQGERETDPHITVKYGLKVGVSSADVAKVCQGFGHVCVVLGVVDVFTASAPDVTFGRHITQQELLAADPPNNFVSLKVITKRAAEGRWAIAAQSFESTDRYPTPPPNSNIVCTGQCEGMGWIPVYIGSGDIRKSNPDHAYGPDETDPELIAAWYAADAVSKTDDGWHFVKCPACAGTGVRGLVRRVLRGCQFESEAHLRSLIAPRAGDVVKINIESPDLHRLNNLISSLPHTDTYPDYQPHITLAYVPAGQGAYYKGISSFVGEEFTVSEIVFCDMDGGETTIPLLPHVLGGKGSGNFNHKGRKGEVGGSGEGLDEAAKLYGGLFKDSKKVIDESKKVLRGKPAAKDAFGAAAAKLIDEVRSAPEQTISLYRGLGFRDPNKQLEDLKIGDTLTLDQLSSFSESREFAAYYADKAHFSSGFSYELKTEGAVKTVATDKYTGFKHKEHITMGKFKVVHTEDTETGIEVQIPASIAGEGQLRLYHKRSIVLKQVGVF